MGQILTCVADVEAGGDGGAKVLVEVVPDFVADDEHEAREARQRTVVERVVEQRSAARADGRELLEAAEAGRPAGREDDEGEGWGGGSHRESAPRDNGQSCTYSTPRSSYTHPSM